MRNWIALLFFTCSCALCAHAQPINNPNELSYVVVPSESVTLVVASQQNCPVEIVESQLLNPVDGSRRAEFRYELINRGTKPIKYVSVHALNSTGTGGGPLYNGHIFSKPLMPGTKIAVGKVAVRIVDPSLELATQLKLHGPLRAIVILLIENVQYTDGSAFSDTKTVKALLSYFVDINSEEINLRANGTDVGTVLKSPNPN